MKSGRLVETVRLIKCSKNVEFDSAQIKKISTIVGGLSRNPKENLLNFDYSHYFQKLTIGVKKEMFQITSAARLVLKFSRSLSLPHQELRMIERILKSICKGLDILTPLLELN